MADAARLLWSERLNAFESDDAETVQEIDGIVWELRGHLEGDERLAEFDALVSGQALTRNSDSAPRQMQARQRAPRR